MNHLRTAAQQALEALNSIDVGCRSPSGNPLEVSFDEGRCEAAITALRAALAQQAEPVQEPEGMVEFLADLQRSRTKYPKNRRMFDGLMGEIDELRRAYAGDGDIRAEAFDVAVCAFRIATEGDAGGNARLEQAEPVSADPHTTTLRNLLKCCLSWEPDACVLGNVTARQAITALRAALAQQAEPVQELVAAAVVATQSDVWRGYNGQWAPPGEPIKMVQMLRDLPTGTLLYTSPPQRKPLKKEQLLYIYNQLPNWGMDMDSLPQGLEKFARAVERAHGIKE